MSYPHENRVVAASDSERVSQIAVSVVNACFTKHIIDHTPLLLPLPAPPPHLPSENFPRAILDSAIGVLGPNHGVGLHPF